MALTKITGQVVDTTTDLVVGVTTVGGGVSAVDGFFSGIVTFSNDVSIAGTLTYEDVTNIDAVGLITARNGVVVGSGITLSKDGDVFFTGIATGNGSGLTDLNASNLSSGTVPTARLGSGTASSSTFLRGDSTFATVTSTTINNNANNRVITGSGTADTLEGESSFTYDGNGMVDIEGTGAAGIQIKTPNSTDGGVYFRTGSTNAGAVTYLHTDNSMNFRVNSTNKLTINSSGNLVLGVAGAGIDFSAQTATSATGASATAEILDHYEEGTWTPYFVNISAPTYGHQSGTYTRIGRAVHCQFQISVDSGLDNTDSSGINIGGLPFAGNSSHESVVFSFGKLTNIITDANLALVTNFRFGGNYIMLHRGSSYDLNYQACNTSGHLQGAFTYQMS